MVQFCPSLLRKGRLCQTWYQNHLLGLLFGACPPVMVEQVHHSGAGFTAWLPVLRYSSAALCGGEVGLASLRQNYPASEALLLTLKA